MIFYFSGTGNSRWAALSIAAQLKEKAWNITDILKKKEKMPQLKEGEAMGFVFPIYGWQVPEHVMEFIQHVHKTKENFSYAVCTCGEDTGNAMKILQKRTGIDSVYPLVLASNYIITSDVEPVKEQKEKIEKAKEEIRRIVKEVQERRTTSRGDIGGFGFIKSNIIGAAFNKFAKTTKPFSVSDACNGCGLCAKNCPSDCIAIKEGRPGWIHSSCYQCLSCINRCPKQAIQYGKITKKRSRYICNEQPFV